MRLRCTTPDCCIALLAVWAAVQMPQAVAHDWYPIECCADRDCAPADTVVRRADEIESWRRQVVSQEGRVEQRVRAMQMDPSEEVLDREFPMHTARCNDYNHPCQFLPICFRPGVAKDPLGSGLYQIRQSNHPEKESE